MMRFDIISAVPQVLTGPLEHSIVGRAREKNELEVVVHDLREYSEDKHRKVDDYPYGGGAGMVLSPQPIFSCIKTLKSQRIYDEIIFTAPDGQPFNQEEANRLSMKKNIILLCGHYKGVDQRVRDALITKEYSIGDYVLSGGELPAMVIVDASARLLPGVLGDSESALTDSFQNGLLDAPHYTRPAEYDGLNVPDVLLSGDHEKIAAWRETMALKKTKERRKDLYQNITKDL